MSEPQIEMGTRALVGVGLASAALMATEIVLTRVLSVTVWYHFAFFAISVALLGTGLSAIAVHAAQGRLAGAQRARWLWGGAVVQAVATLGAALAVSAIRPDWFGGASGLTTIVTARLLLTFAITALPFLAGGFVIALAIAWSGARVHRFYFADLVGAAAGCLATIPLVAWLGGPRALAACGAFATLAACVCALELRVRSRSVALAVVALLVALQIVVVRSSALELRVAKGLDLSRMRPELTLWNSFSHIAVFNAQHFAGWGLSPRYRGSVAEQRELLIDMSALTSITRFDGDFTKLEHLAYDLSALVYRVTGQGGAARVCVIGAGGGRDVLTALGAGARHVTAVEINPLIVEDVMRGAYRAFSGNLYSRPDVTVEIGDGRSYLRATRASFDVIVISMVDTSAATAAGAYALTENGVYTRQAFGELLARLAPGGMLSVSTVSLPGLAVGARLASLARAAVRARGGDPQRAVAVVRSAWLGLPGAELYAVLVKPDGFTDAQLEALKRAIAQQAFTPAFIPQRRFVSANAEDRLVQQILTEPSETALSAALASYPLDATVVDDDRPFFFYQNRFGDFLQALVSPAESHLFGNGLRILAKVLVLAFGMLLLCSVLPLAWTRRSAQTTERGLGRELAYVISLGIGFMCIEIALVHRVTIYVAQPTYTLVAVLFVMLAGGGIGSRWLAPRLAGSTRAWSWYFAAIALLALSVPASFALLSSSLAVRSLALRATAAALVIAPLAILLGAALPAGLSRISARDATRVAWLWGVNGAASVFGSIVATLVALHAGTFVTLACGALAYAAAAFSWRRL